ncbi:hypothetical protein [Actinomadura keratinilytica]|uniref:DNA polymerase III subunits gamma and tau n=1 Tax=Actinomadura keratinilytica TaxID=547461 RepID=A0ABP7YEZ9_9ACTN
MVQRMWPDIVEAVKQRSRVAWMAIMSGVQPISLEGNLLTLSFEAEGARTNFTNGGRDAVLREVLKQRLGVDWRIDTVLAGAAPARGRGGGPAKGRPGGMQGGSPGPAAAFGGSAAPAPSRGPAEPAPAPVPPPPSAPAASDQGPWTVAAPKPSVTPAPVPPPADEPPPPEPPPLDESDEVDPEGDADADGSEAELNGMALIMRELGGQIIREIDNT